MRETALLETLFRLTPPQKAGLKKLKIETALDLLYHFPSRYVSSAQVLEAELTPGEKVTVVGRVISQKAKKSWKTKVPMAEMTIENTNGRRIKATWFHQAYMAKKVLLGTTISLTGTVTERKGTTYLANPILNEDSMAQPGPLFSQGLTSWNSGELTAIYPETWGLSSLWFLSHVDHILKSGVLEQVKDPIPKEILKKYNLPSLRSALVWIHTPKKTKDAEVARKRFAFEEIFFIQLSRQKARDEYKSNPTFSVPIREVDLKEFVDRFPFAATEAQHKAIRVILEDLAGDKPMTRLLEGDVGSGKTAVAASTAFGVVMTPTHQGQALGNSKGLAFGNLQVAYMAPTEILARQHFESFIEYFRHLPIQIGLITGTECRKFPSKINPDGYTHISRAQLLKWVANGEIPILIGTHALIQKTVKFKHLAYVIVDEQHRFGTGQRAKLTRKATWSPRGDHVAKTPHYLSMTATPIPRTLALTIYGDLDLTLLDQMPAGRKPVKTEIVGPKERTRVYEHIREEWERISKYQATGDIASLEELRSYLLSL